jgi:hypothetical protein
VADGSSVLLRGLRQDDRDLLAVDDAAVKVRLDHGQRGRGAAVWVVHDDVAGR